MNTGFSASTANISRPLAGGRFDVELRQAVAFRPTGASRTELVIVVRNLFRDLGGALDEYDEGEGDDG